MKRMLVVLVAAVALGATATADAGGGAGFAAGSSQLTVHNVFGLQTLELQHFVFVATASANGGARGFFSYREIDDGVPFAAAGPITCMSVIGQDAWFGATIQQSSDPSYIGQGGWWHVTDNGFGPFGSPDITTFLGTGTLQQTSDYCATHPPYKHPFSIDRGDILVHD